MYLVTIELMARKGKAPLMLASGVKNEMIFFIFLFNKNQKNIGLLLSYLGFLAFSFSSLNGSSDFFVLHIPLFNKPIPYNL